MFEKINEDIDKIVKTRIDEHRKNLLADIANIADPSEKSQIIANIDNIYNTSIPDEIVNNFFPTPNFSYILDGGYDDGCEDKVLFWISKDFKYGVYTEVYYGMCVLGKFKITRRGKTGRQLTREGGIHIDKDLFFKALDDYIADQILLGRK